MKATKCLKVSKTSKRKIKMLQCNLQDVPTFLCYLLSDPLLLVPKVVDVLVLLQLLLPGALLQVLGYNICVGLGELLGPLLLLSILRTCHRYFLRHYYFLPSFLQARKCLSGK